ncbi:MAG: DeoR family transcriptional regulator [Arenicella sp.]|nr:DeoR family transcriptional regulator [Arenicella sp.]
MSNNEPSKKSTSRREKIVKLVRKKGFVPISMLAENLGVTPQTIRRDINKLCDGGVLRRYHGGAGLVSSTENIDYENRQEIQHKEKQAIAKRIADYIPNNVSLFINIGTTNEEISQALLKHKNLKVVTNNLNVANILSRNDSFEVIIAGGTVRSRDQGITGEATIDLIQQFKVDFGIIGISAIDEDGSLMDFDYHEVRVTQAIIRNSRQTLLAADNSKYGRNAMVKLGHLSQIDIWFTNDPPPLSLSTS